MSRSFAVLQASERQPKNMQATEAQSKLLLVLTSSSSQEPGATPSSRPAAEYILCAASAVGCMAFAVAAASTLRSSSSVA